MGVIFVLELELLLVVGTLNNSRQLFGPWTTNNSWHGKYLHYKQISLHYICFTISSIILALLNTVFTGA